MCTGTTRRSKRATQVWSVSPYAGCQVGLAATPAQSLLSILWFSTQSFKKKKIPLLPFHLSLRDVPPSWRTMRHCKRATQARSVCLHAGCQVRLYIKKKRKKLSLSRSHVFLCTMCMHSCPTMRRSKTTEFGLHSSIRPTRAKKKSSFEAISLVFLLTRPWSNQMT